jgi:hypothetical protein
MPDDMAGSKFKFQAVGRPGALYVVSLYNRPRCVRPRCSRRRAPTFESVLVNAGGFIMTIVRRGGWILLLLVAGTLVAAAATTDKVVKQEPPMGKMTLGQRLLVDDGSCPRGQIKEVIGGDHVNVGGTQHIVRKSRCIPR